MRSILHDRGVQAKLKVGPANDKYEREADRVADQVVKMSDADVTQRSVSGAVQPVRIAALSSGSDQCVCAECEQELQTKLIDRTVQRQSESEDDEEEVLQTKSRASGGSLVDSGAEAAVTSLRGGGTPLPGSERSYFEPRFGADFGAVRLHTDGRAAHSARALNARAFALGQDIVFGAGEYKPGTAEGRRLLAHELTHVRQQSGAGASRFDVSRTIRLQPIDCTATITGVAAPRNPTQEVIDAHNLALTWAREALTQINTVRQGRTIDPTVQRALDTDFASPTGARLNMIRILFEGTVRRLARGTGIYHCNTAGSEPCLRCVRRQPGPVAACTYVPSAPGEYTRVCPGFFGWGARERARVLIHEAAHAAGVLGDVYRGASYPGTNPQANAESYGRFALTAGTLMGLLRLRPHVPSAPAPTRRAP